MSVYVLWGLILLVRVCDMLWTQLLPGFEFMWWPIFFYSVPVSFLIYTIFYSFVIHTLGAIYNNLILFSDSFVFMFRSFKFFIFFF